MKRNCEIFVLLFVIFYIFVTLVCFYESKLKEIYYPKNNLSLSFKVEEINDNIVKIDGKYIELDESIKNRLKPGLEYTFYFKDSKKKVVKGDLDSLFKKYVIKKIHYGVYE